MKLSVIVPTLGRSGLERLLESVNPGPKDEILLVGDLSGDTDNIEAQAKKFKARLVWSDESSIGGTAMRNLAMPLAKGDYLVFNDDTDVFTPGALEGIRESASLLSEPAPLLFRVQLPGCVLWGHEPRTGEGEVDGHQFVPPNIPAKLGQWAIHGSGDYYFIRDTLEKWGGHYHAVDQIIADCVC